MDRYPKVPRPIIVDSSDKLEIAFKFNSRDPSPLIEETFITPAEILFVTMEDVCVKRIDALSHGPLPGPPVPNPNIFTP